MDPLAEDPFLPLVQSLIEVKSEKMEILSPDGGADAFQRSSGGRQALAAGLLVLHIRRIHSMQALLTQLRNTIHLLIHKRLQQV